MMFVRLLKNDLYVVSSTGYLSLENCNIVVTSDDGVEKVPLRIFDNIFVFSYKGVSPALMGYCVKNNIGLVFCKPNGQFLCRIDGESHGNVLLRREQYRWADDEQKALAVGKNMIVGKLKNCRFTLDIFRRSHSMSIDVDSFRDVSSRLDLLCVDVINCSSLGELRGYEGVGSSLYFGLLDNMVLRNKSVFGFVGRNRRPPLDPVNSLLFFMYSILSNECASALEAYGLDSYVGFVHSDRSGRKSLALDFIEEFRSCMVDRFVLMLINKGIVLRSDFDYQSGGAVFLNDDGRKKVLTYWHKRKSDKVWHEYLGESVTIGLVPYIQAQLLSKFVRGDLDGYPSFVWR